MKRLKVKALIIILFCTLLNVVEAQICGTTAAWDRVITYNGGEEVQYNNVKYLAKWWTRDQAPDVNSATASDPWELIGNCDGSVDTLSCVGLEVWLATTEYNAGDRIIFDNNIYTANYYTLNQNPPSNIGPAGSPWTFVGACESTTESTCDVSTPSFEFDLTGAPDSLWVSPQVRRDGLCCSIDPSERPPARCVEFFFTLDPSAIGIIFDIQSGAVPPGALFFQINCQGRYQFGELLCLSGVGPFRLTFCKPGNNPNVYAIQSVPGPSVSPPVTVSDGCSADIFATGYDLSTVEWTSVPSNPVWESYMSCQSQCDSVHVTYQPGAPDSVIYQVSGFPPGGCLPDPVIQQTVVYFVNDKTADIQPKDAMVCFGSNTAELTVYPSGGRAPHRYLWSTGETTQSIFVAQGSYSVEVFDNTTCPSASDSVEVGAFLFPIEALAGPDQRLCESATSIQLDGAVVEALGGRWSGGGGFFTPNDSTLDAVYFPTALEVVNGLTLTLTTTGNRGCPGDADQVVFTFDAAPTIIAPDTAYACLNNPVAEISASFTDATVLMWEAINGGSISPNNSASTIFYTPTAAELAAESTIIRVTADGNPSCPAVIDTVNISFTQPPSVNVGPGQETCSNNPQGVTLTASPIIAGGVQWTGGAGGYSPNSTSLSVTYTPTAAEALNTSLTLTATTTDNNGCLPVSEQVVVNFTPAPTVQVTPNFTVCESATNIPLEAIIQNATGVVWSGGLGTYSSTTNTSINYTPDATELTQGFSLLTATTTNDRGCLNASATVRISFDLAPTISLPTPIFVCANNSITRIDAAITNADSVIWSFGGTGTLTILDANSVEYNPSPEDTAAGIITVSATTVSTSVCPEETFNSTVEFTGSPSVVITTSASVCANNSEVSLSATTNNTSIGVVWTGGEGAFVPNRITAAASYYPSINEINNGVVSLTVQTTNVGDCLPTNDVASIIINPAPEIEAGPNLSICGDQLSINVSAEITNSSSLIWESTTGGIFNDPTSLTTNYNFSIQDKADSIANIRVSTSGNSPCLEVSDFLTVTLNEVPKVNAGGDITLCTAQNSTEVNGTVTLSNSGTWTSSGTGVFNPINTDLKTNYEPSADDRLNGNVILTLTSDPYQECDVYFDQMVVSFAAGPVLNIMPDFTVCRNTSNIPILAEGSLGEWSGIGTFVNGIRSHSNVYIPTGAEFLNPSTELKFTTFATTFCPSIQDSVTISFIDGPTLTPLVIDTICANEGSFSLVSNQTNATGVSWTTSGFGGVTPSSTNNSIIYNLNSTETATNDTLSINFRVSTTGNGLCPATERRVSNVIVPQNNVQVQSSVNVCYSQGILQLSGFGNPNENYVWSTTGGGNFPSGNSGLNVSYQMVPSDTILDSVRFIVSSVGNPYCDDYLDTSYYKIITGPSVDAGPTQTVCRDVMNVTFTGIATKNISQKWSTNGTGELINSDSLIVNYIRSDQDTVQGSVMFYLEVIGQGGCDLLVDSVLLIFEEGVIVSATDVFDVCSDSAFIDLTVDFSKATGVAWEVLNGNGTFNDSSLTTTRYTLHDLDREVDSLSFKVTTVGNDDCFAQFDVFEVRLTPIPVITPNNVFICEDASSVLLDGAIVNAGGINFDVLGSGTATKLSEFQSNYVIVPQDTLSDSLLVVLTSTDMGLCKPVVDTSVIYFTPKPIIDAGNDTTLCISETSYVLQGDYTVAASGFWTHDGSGSLSPNAQTKQPRYLISDSDKAKGNVNFVFISILNGSCQSYLDGMTMTFSEPVEINPTSVSSCESTGGAMPIFPDVENALTYQWKTLGSGTFSPVDFVKDVSYNPSTTDRLQDSIIVRLIASSCTSDSIDFTLYFEPAPTVEAIGDASICVGQTGQYSLSSEFSESIGWIKIGSGSVSPSLLDSSIFYSPSAADIINANIQLVAYATKFGCPTDYDTVNIEILKTPILNAGNNRSLCREVTSININGSLAFASTNRWETTGTGSFVDPNSKSTVYTFSEEDKELDFLYLYFIVDPFECFSEQRDSILISFSDAPRVDGGPDQVICTEDIGVVFSGSYSNAQGIKWTTLGSGTFNNINSRTPTYYYGATDAVSKSATVIVETIGASACNHDRDTVELALISSPIVDAGDDKVYCGVLPDIPLTANVQDATEWEWYSSGVGTFLNPINQLSNTYRAAEIDTIIKTVEFTMFASINGGCYVYDTLNVIFEVPPKILIENTNACIGEEIELLGKPVGFLSTGANYKWYLNNGVLPGVQDSLIRVNASGLYKVLMSIDECFAEKEASISFNPAPENYPTKQLYICEEQGEAIVVKGEGGNTAYNYYWPHVNDSTRSVIVNESGDYNYVIINEYGCTSQNKIIVDDICPPRLFPPTIITPNGDGRNDQMTIKGKFVESYNLTIFNRWGEIIFYTENMEDYWDGTYRGEPMPEGVYNWIIEYEGDKRVSEKVVLKGIITVVR